MSTFHIGTHRNKRFVYFRGCIKISHLIVTIAQQGQCSSRPRKVRQFRREQLDGLGVLGLLDGPVNHVRVLNGRLHCTQTLRFYLSIFQNSNYRLRTLRPRRNGERGSNWRLNSVWSCGKHVSTQTSTEPLMFDSGRIGLISLCSTKCP